VAPYVGVIEATVQKNLFSVERSRDMFARRGMFNLPSRQHLDKVLFGGARFFTLPEAGKDAVLS